MAMITDRDLLTIEPSIFVDAQGEGTLLTEASDASVTRSSRRLDSVSSDFISDGITTSHVVVVTYPTSDIQVLEITSATAATTLVVSRIRAQSSDPAIGPQDGSALPIKIITFQRAIDQAQAWVLGALGLVDTGQVDDLDETDITNPEDVKRMIATLTIARVFAGAAAGAPADAGLAAQSALYSTRVKETAHQTRVLIDLDGDGLPEATRRIDVLALVRD